MDGVTWKELSVLLAPLLGALAWLVYQNLSGRIKKNSSSIELLAESQNDIGTRLAVLERLSEDQHQQMMTALGAITSELRDWRVEAQSWREIITKEIANINGRIVLTDSHVTEIRRTLTERT
jgi:membrane protein implicated in regulation of membrane protease activity